MPTEDPYGSDLSRQLVESLPPNTVVLVGQMTDRGQAAYVHSKIRGAGPEELAKIIGAMQRSLDGFKTAIRERIVREDGEDLAMFFDMWHQMALKQKTALEGARVIDRKKP